MSIVKKYSQQIQTLATSLTAQVEKVVALNKAESRYNYFSDSGMTKGVDSDHIKIFKVKGGWSFAFAFYYAKVATPYIMVSVKEDKNLQLAKYTEAEFKVKLNQFVQVVKVDATNLRAQIKAHFIQGQEYDGAAEVAETVILARATLQTIKDQHQVLMERYQDHKDLLDTKEKVIEAKVEALEVELQIKKMQADLRKAQEQVSVARKKWELKEKVKTLRDQVRHLNRDKFKYESEVHKALDLVVGSLPKPEREKVKAKLLRELKLS